MQIGKEKIGRYYKLKLWSKDQLKEAVACGEITEAEYLEIVGETYVPLPTESTQLDRIESAINELGAESLPISKVETAIMEGVNGI